MSADLPEGPGREPLFERVGSGEGPGVSVQDAASPLEPAVDAAAADARSSALFRGRRRGRALWAAAALLLLLALILGLAAADFIAAWIVRAPIIGWGLAALAGLAALGLVWALGAERAALVRLRRCAALREAAARAIGAEDAAACETAAAALAAFLRRRPELAVAAREWRSEPAEPGLERLFAAERRLVAPLDAAAAEAIAEAAGRVATVTALAPSALLDAAASLAINLAMMRRIGAIYGGRGGFFASAALARRAVAQAMAAGLIALGDDLLEPLIGGGVAGRLSRRLGEGVVNGAMTARLGLAAMTVCRPAPFHAESPPKMRALLWRARKSAVGQPV